MTRLPENRKNRGFFGSTVACRLKGLFDARMPSGRSRLSTTQPISRGEACSARSALTSVTSASMSVGEPDTPFGGVHGGGAAESGAAASGVEMTLPNGFASCGPHPATHAPNANHAPTARTRATERRIDGARREELTVHYFGD